MKNELKVKVLDALSKAEPTCFTKDNVYKCGNDGMVCFNGMIAELINGNKYEEDDYWDIAYERAQEGADEMLLAEVKDQLASNDLWDEIPVEVQNEMIDKRFESVRENYDLDVSYEEVNQLVGEAIADDLDNIYSNTVTQEFINGTHYAWINDEIDFDVAMAEVERHIVENE